MGLNIPFSFEPPNETDVWMVHDVTDRQHAKFDSSAVCEDSFKSLLDSTRKNVRWIEEGQLLNDQAVNTNRVLVTFDDAWKSFYDNVMPLVADYGIPVVLFVTTEFIGDRYLPYELVIRELCRHKNQQGEDILNVEGESINQTPTENVRSLYAPVCDSGLSRQERYLNRLLECNGVDRNNICGDGPYFLSEKQVREVAEHPLVTIGCHGRYHTRLKLKNISDYYDEVFTARRRLEEMVGRQIDIYAYPYGANNPLLQSLVWLAGFSRAYGTRSHLLKPRDKYPLYDIPRRDVAQLSEGELS